MLLFYIIVWNLSTKIFENLNIAFPETDLQCRQEEPRKA